MYEQDKIYPIIAFNKNNDAATFRNSSPWPDASTAFTWANRDFPFLHKHLDWEIAVVTNDSIVNYIDGDFILMRVGDACLVGPMNEHALFYPNNIKNSYQGFSMLCTDEYIKNLLNIYSLDLYDEIRSTKTPLIFHLNDILLNQIQDSLLEIQTVKNGSTPLLEMKCNIIFNSLIDKFLEQRYILNDTPSYLRYFVKELNNPEITKNEIKTLESNAPYCYSQLTRLFKKYYGCTITQYVNNIKLNYSKELLTNTDLAITDISSKLNFETISHYNHLFKKEYGISPLQYRKNNTKNRTHL